MNTISIATATVTGARHLRTARNGQDAAASWSADGAAVVVVCDGCGSGASSEVGARLGAQLFARALGARLAGGARADSSATWDGARGDVARALADLLERLPGDRLQVIHDCLLFTIVAAAVTPEAAAVWALGDGAFSIGSTTHVLGPFENNQPPYLAYDLLADARPARFEIAPPGTTTLVVATDGVCDLEVDVAGFANLVAPDALRRKLALFARSEERIDWDARRVVRTPASLQDDCAVGVLRWGWS
jgi:hypothetical protein